MKKLLILAALVLFPLIASAKGDALLTDKGVLYTIDEQSLPHGAVQLLLTTRQGVDINRQVVPATNMPGVHSNAVMAYDSEAGMLYIFWLRYTGLLESELLFTSLSKDGFWSEATAFGTPFDYRENLRIAVTRKVVGNHDKLEPGITVHATWWETDTHTGIQSAQYAMLAMENGKAEVTFLNLGEHVPEGGSDAELNEDEISALRQPMLFPSARQESVLVTFGDLRTERLHRVRVYPVRPPVSDGRIRIPVGRSEGNIDAPRFRSAANGMNALQGDDDDMALYVRDGEQLRYVLLREGKWSEERAIALDDQITASAAVDAIRRLVTEH